MIGKRITYSETDVQELQISPALHCQKVRSITDGLACILTECSEHQDDFSLFYICHLPIKTWYVDWNKESTYLSAQIINGERPIQYKYGILLIMPFSTLIPVGPHILTSRDVKSKNRGGSAAITRENKQMSIIREFREHHFPTSGKSHFLPNKQPKPTKWNPKHRFHQSELLAKTQRVQRTVSPGELTSKGWAHVTE